MIEKRSKDIAYKNNSKKVYFSTKAQNNKTKVSNNSKIKFLSKKTMHFKIEREDQKIDRNTETGRWTKDEKEKFIEGIVLYGTNWKKFINLIKTRTLIQIRSHAQKFLIKLKNYKNEKLSIDFTLETIASIKDMIDQIKSINSNYNIKNIFQFLLNECDKIRKNKKKKLNKVPDKGNGKDIDEKTAIFKNLNIYNTNNDNLSNITDSTEMNFIANPFNRVIPFDNPHNISNNKNLQKNDFNLANPSLNNFVSNNSLIQKDKDENKTGDNTINDNTKANNLNNTNINIINDNSRNNSCANNLNYTNFNIFQNSLIINSLLEYQNQLLINYLKNNNLANQNLISNIPFINSLAIFNHLLALLMKNSQTNKSNNIEFINNNNNFLNFQLLNNNSSINPNFMNGSQNRDNLENNEQKINLNNNNVIYSNNSINENRENISKYNHLIDNDLMANNSNENISADFKTNHNINEDKTLNNVTNLDTFNVINYIHQNSDIIKK